MSTTTELSTFLTSCLTAVKSNIKNVNIYERNGFLMIKRALRVCNSSMFCCTLLYVHSSLAIILMGKKELVAFVRFLFD